MRIPHNYSATEQFVRERGPLPEDIVEPQTRVGFIFRRVVDAVAQHDFAKAREYSEDEGRERETSYCQQSCESHTETPFSIKLGSKYSHMLRSRKVGFGSSVLQKT